MAVRTFQDLRISKEIRISADFEQASSAIWWQDLRDDPAEKTWQSTPYQVADAKHDDRAALGLVSDWLNVE